MCHPLILPDIQENGSLVVPLSGCHQSSGVREPSRHPSRLWVNGTGPQFLFWEMEIVPTLCAYPMCYREDELDMGRRCMIQAMGFRKNCFSLVPCWKLSQDQLIILSRSWLTCILGERDPKKKCTVSLCPKPLSSTETSPLTGIGQLCKAIIPHGLHSDWIPHTCQALSGMGSAPEEVDIFPWSFCNTIYPPQRDSVRNSPQV